MKRNELARLESEADCMPKTNWPEREREGGGLDLVWTGHLIGWETSKGSADRRLADISLEVFNPSGDRILLLNQRNGRLLFLVVETLFCISFQYSKAHDTIAVLHPVFLKREMGLKRIPKTRLWTSIVLGA